MVGMTSVVKLAEERARLLRELEEVAQLLRTNEEDHTRILFQRAEKVRSLREVGAPIEDIQEVLGISRSRVHQILRDART